MISNDTLHSGIYKKLFEEGDFFITHNEMFEIGFERESVIIHECPNVPGDHKAYHPGEPFIMIITMPNGKSGPCYYCSQTVPTTIKALYILQNFDHFVSDSHARSNIYKYGPSRIKFPRRNG